MHIECNRVYIYIICIFLPIYLLGQGWTLANRTELLFDQLRKLDQGFLLYADTLLLSILGILAWLLFEDYIYNNHLLCQIYGSSGVLLWGSLKFLAICFGYGKIEAYPILDRSEKMKTIMKILRMVIIIWALVLLPSSFLLGVLNSGPKEMENETRTCVDHQQTVFAFLYVMQYLFFFSCGSIIYFVHYIIDQKGNLIDHFRKQIELNLFVLGVIYSSSFAIMIFGLIIIWIFPQHAMIGLFCSEIIDGTINQCFMFYSIYNKDASDSIQEFIQSVESESSEESQSESVYNPPPLPPNQGYWLEFPGMHPIKAIGAVIEQTDSRKFIISDSSKIRAMKKYFKGNKTCIPSMHWNVCMTPEDLSDQKRDLELQKQFFE